MTRVYVDMVADLFHQGHVEFLRRARLLGDELIAGVHSDETVGTYKRKPVFTMDERIAVVAACRYVDEVVRDAPLRVTRHWIEKHRLDLVVHGDDIDRDTERAFYKDAMALGIYRTIAYTAGISTSGIIERIRRRLVDRDL